MEDRLDKFREIFNDHFSETARGYDQFADILSGLAGKSERPWQKTFIYNLLNKAKGFKVSDDMWQALLAFERERSLAMRSQQIMSVYEIPHNSIVVATGIIECAWCDAYLIPDHPMRRYCKKRCRLDARNERRRERRKSVL